MLHHGKEFKRYSRTNDGTVVQLFADGATATADVLVAADGTTSRVRGQFLPHAERVGYVRNGRCALWGLVGRLIEGSHPFLCWLVAESFEQNVSLLPICASVRIPRWETTNITLLGDAIPQIDAISLHQRQHRTSRRAAARAQPDCRRPGRDGPPLRHPTTTRHR